MNNENEKILVKVDQNNLVYIDPNSAIDTNGVVTPRNVKQENLVMYVNLEADLIPRTTLIAENDKNTLTSVAKGTLNFLKSNTNRDFDTSWTDTYLDVKKDIDDTFYSNDFSAQSFGIESINIVIKGVNSIPQVNITFVDIRGKTLFEYPDKSPYSAFFHLPWPIFYLTVKGFYGKAIRYRLHLVKFTSSYNDSNGNFEIATSFVGSTYAYMSDIPLKGMLNSPYMYMVETLNNNKSNGTITQKKISRSSKGYAILKSVYDECKQKGLLPKDFPVKTLRELIVAAQNLDKTLETQILGQNVDAKLFVGMNDYDEKLKLFENSVDSWSRTNLLKTTRVFNGKTYYIISSDDKTKDTILKGSTTQGTLEFILTKRQSELDNSELFANTLFKNNAGGNFTKSKLLAKKIGKINDYIYQFEDKFWGVAAESLFDDLTEIRKTFTEQNTIFQTNIEEQMNRIIKDKSKSGIGFEPTLRNIFGVILANADAYIRLMKNVHEKAFEQREVRQKLLGNIETDTPKTEPAIFPWPQIKKKGTKDKPNILAYPGDVDLIKTLNSNDYSIWPEIGFLENYIDVATNKLDTLTDKETGIAELNFVFDGDSDKNNITNTSTVTTVVDNTPYVNKEPSAFLYELWERALFFTYLDSYNNESLKEIAYNEFTNIKESTKEEDDIIDLLKNKVYPINNVDDLDSLLKSYSPYQRYPYKQDLLPTTDYLKNLLSSSFTLEQYEIPTRSSSALGFEKLNANLSFYNPEEYRQFIYPYNSSLYLDYIGKTNYTTDDLKFYGLFTIDVKEGFVVSQLRSQNWSKKDNLFKEKIIIGDTETSILNTPYFHNQLYSDYNKEGSFGKYAGSSYLLLNSLPFYDLYENILYDNKSYLVSSIFREIGATHFLPYHLICKWGSLYHRYKKYIIDGVDILDGFLTTGNTSTSINGGEFFNNNQTGSTFTGFTVGDNTVTFSGRTDIGMHPYYDSIYHSVINGYSHYDTTLGNASFSAYTENNSIITKLRKRDTFNYWTSIVDNSKYTSTDLRYTILPSTAENLAIGATSTVLHGAHSFDAETQNNFRIVLQDEYINDDFSGKTFSAYNQYNKSYSANTHTDSYAISSDYKKIIDLIGTFSPAILEDFENIFLNFASEKLNNTSTDFRFTNTLYTKFQDLVTDIVTVKKETTDEQLSKVQLLEKIKDRQNEKFRLVSSNILSSNNTVKFTISNPKEINPNLLDGFAKISTGNTFSYNEYDSSQLTQQNLNYIKLYIGEDIDNYYQNFFSINNVELSEDNILLFRPLVLLYAGYVKAGKENTKAAFIKYISDELFNKKTGNKTLPNGFINRLNYFISELKNNFQRLVVIHPNDTLVFLSGYNNQQTKLELYNYFKSFNDKWIAGNSIGQRLLLEEFLFLDKANKDIGNETYLNISRLLQLNDPKNEKIDLYSVISILIQGTGFDMRPLPAYVNFYGTNYNTKTKIVPSEKVATNIFGTFLDVDYQESSPKIIIQYTGANSMYLADMNNKKYKFLDDSFNIGNPSNNSLIITTPSYFQDSNLHKSNRVVAFEVSFGDQNQSIFKTVKLSQDTLKNTSESFVVLENMARSESGAAAYNVDTSLFDVYRQASYQCEVTMLGNVMIQPTMFFYVKNIPMFRGSYWITEVSHDIRGNSITTTFRGSRIPYPSLPKPEDSFASSYRSLFDKIKEKALTLVRNNESSNVTTTEKTTVDSKGNVYIYEAGSTIISGEKFTDNASITDYGIPYNGYMGEKYIQLITNSVNGVKETWLRGKVCQLGGNNCQIDDSYKFEIVSSSSSGLTWGNQKAYNKTNDFYITKFKYNTKINNNIVTSDYIRGFGSTFYNPLEKVKYSISNMTINDGAIGVGPLPSGYGIGLSQHLMMALKLHDGDIVYFRLE